jgi:type IV fimbrial biogenesis protein FimT
MAFCKMNLILMSKCKFQTGFTLVELMVTLAVAGIVVSLATPSFNEMIANSRLTSAANELVGALSYARSEAVKRGVNVVMLSRSGTDGVWESGWDVFVDANDDYQFNRDVAEQCAPNQDCMLRSYEPLPNGYTLRVAGGGGGNGYAIRATFKPSGFPESVIGGTFKLCDGSGDVNLSRRIAINTIGRVRMATDAPPADTCDL